MAIEEISRAEFLKRREEWRSKANLELPVEKHLPSEGLIIACDGCGILINDSKLYAGKGFGLCDGCHKKWRGW